MKLRSSRVAIVLFASISQALLAFSDKFTFMWLPPGPPGASQPLPSAINRQGNIVGSFIDPAGTHSFFLESFSSTYKIIDRPRATRTSAADINDKGEMVGSYVTVHPGSPDKEHGFLLENGRFTTIDYPGAVGTSLRAINNAGVILGTITSPVISFLYSNGEFYTVPCPDGKPADLFAISNNGRILRYCRGERYTLISPEGQESHIDLLGPVPDKYIAPHSMNDKGEIVGCYFVGEKRFGFLFTGGEFITIDAVRSTVVSGINDNSEIVGFGGRSFFGIPAALR